MQRRNFIKMGGFLALGALSPSLYAGFLEDHAKAFTFKSAPEAMGDLYGKAKSAADSKVELKVPDIAENGAAVPVSISTTLPDAVEMSIFVEKNPYPLIAVWEIHENIIPDFSTRIRMGETSNVILVVKTKDGTLHTATKEVKVTVGGCGG